MEKFAKTVIGMLLVSASLLLVVIIGTLVGAVTGFVVGIFFTPTLTTVMDALGIHNVAVWQFGAFLGFVGPFIRSSR